MYAAVLGGRPAACGLTAVRRGDLEYLIKEAEVLTGRPGRQFLVGGADRLTYHVSGGPNVFEIVRIDVGALHKEFVCAEEFDQHRLGAALRAGQLFTPLVE